MNYEMALKIACPLEAVDLNPGNTLVTRINKNSIDISYVYV